MGKFLSKIKGNNGYQNSILQRVLVLFALVFVMIAVFFLSLSIGSSKLNFADVIKAVFGAGDQFSSAIIFDIRLPRIVTGLLVGICLSIAGCVMQSVLKNPLASSSTLGISQGASFGAGLALFLISSASVATLSMPFAVASLAFVGGIACVAIILLLTRFKRISPSSMVLTGVALSSLFAGGTTLLQYFADEDTLSSIVFWTFGDLGKTTWIEIAIILALTIAGFAYFMLNSWKYNAMQFGSDSAKSLGINVELLTIVGLVVATLITASSVAFVGSIGFIGLIAPHIARKIIGNDYRFLLPASACCGGIILLLADLVARTIVAPEVLPIGALTSFLGAPLFVYLIFKEKDIVC